MKIFNSCQHPHYKGIVIEKLYGSIHHIVSMWKPTSVEYFCISLTSTSPRYHKYRKLFNRNNIKISYSCMPNMASVIRNHNTSLLKDPTPTNIKECSCCQKTECSLDKKCLSGYLVFNALVDWLDTNKTKHY